MISHNARENEEHGSKSRGTQQRIKNNAVNAEVAKLADGDKVTYLDIGPKFLAADGTLSKEIMPDLLHLSPAGYQIWADSIEEPIKKLLGE